MQRGTWCLCVWISTIPTRDNAIECSVLAQNSRPHNVLLHYFILCSRISCCSALYTTSYKMYYDLHTTREEKIIRCSAQTHTVQAGSVAVVEHQAPPHKDAPTNQFHPIKSVYKYSCKLE